MEPSVRKKRKNRIRRLIASNTINRLALEALKNKKTIRVCVLRAVTKAAQVCLKKSSKLHLH